MKLCILLQLIRWSVIIENGNGISNPLTPFTIYEHSTELQSNVADLWWTVNDNKQEITFELHIKTMGWIALGSSPGRSFFRFCFRGLSHYLTPFSGWYDRCRYPYWMDRPGRYTPFLSN